MEYLVEPSNVFGTLGVKIEACVNLTCCVVTCIDLECQEFHDGKKIQK